MSNNLEQVIYTGGTQVNSAFHLARVSCYYYQD